MRIVAKASVEGCVQFHVRGRTLGGWIRSE